MFSPCYHHSESQTAQLLLLFLLQSSFNLALPYLQLRLYYILVVCFETKYLYLKDADKVCLFLTQWALFAPEKSETFTCLALLPLRYT